MDLRIYECIRFDFNTGLGSVVDVICWFSGKDSRWARGVLRRTLRQFPNLEDDLILLQWRGKGNPTPFASLTDLLVFAWKAMPRSYSPDMRHLHMQFFVVAFSPRCDVSRMSQAMQDVHAYVSPSKLQLATGRSWVE